MATDTAHIEASNNTQTNRSINDERTTTSARPKRKPKPEGQWSIDGTDPLNKEEEVKQEQEAFEVKQRVIDTYSKQGFDSIPADDISKRFKWLGIYTQRKQNLGGEYTGQLENHELQDKYFMMRVRFDGGQATPERLRVVGEISRDFARSTADFTDRQNIQLHWIRIEDVPEIWRRLDAVGLTTMMGCGDVPRVILGSPTAGVAADEIIDASPAIEEIKRTICRARNSTICHGNSKLPSRVTPARMSPTRSRMWRLLGKPPGIWPWV